MTEMQQKYNKIEWFVWKQTMTNWPWPNRAQLWIFCWAKWFNGANSFLALSRDFLQPVFVFTSGHRLLWISDKSNRHKQLNMQTLKMQPPHKWNFTNISHLECFNIWATLHEKNQNYIFEANKKTNARSAFQRILSISIYEANFPSWFCDCISWTLPTVFFWTNFSFFPFSSIVYVEIC